MPAMVEVSVVNGYEVAGELDVVGSRAGAAIYSITRMYTEVVLRRVKANAKSAQHAPGGPHIGGYTGEGPNMATGNYNRSWGMEMTFDGGSVVGRVGTNHPAARRLELGFVGDDARGAHYNQLPLPHAGPALDSIADDYPAALAAAVVS